MAVDYGMFSFAAPPATCGAWFHRALKLVGLGEGVDRNGNVCTEDDRLTIFPKVFDGKKLRVSVIRHPCWWLASAYRIMKFPEENTAIESHFLNMMFVGLDKKTFDAFVRSFLSSHPTGVSYLFDRYLCNSRIRLEDMPWSLLELLEVVEVPKPMRDRAENYWRTTVCEVLPEWRTYLYQQVLDAEEKFCCEHDYY